MYRFGLAIIALVVAVGCSSGPRYRPAPTPEAPSVRSIDEIYQIRFTLEDFDRRLVDAGTFRATGNHYLFTKTRDSLQVDVNQFIRTHPDMEEQPQFIRILNRLAALDSLEWVAPDTASTALEDSLALQYADWPDLDIELDDGVMFNKYGTPFPEITNRRIDFWIRYFTGPGKARFERQIYRMQQYRPIVDEILREKGMPEELICVAFIESGFAMNAVSYASAVGPWQFIRGTGKMYGLRINWWYDERRDLVASTYAACNYLTDLYNIWNDWLLAMAAYNCGEYRVARAVARQGTKNFWRLDLPTQTERYVPKFLATLYILRDPDKYDIKIPYADPFEFDTIEVTDATDLTAIARAAGTTVREIKRLNPACRQWATPPKWTISVKVPPGTGEDAKLALASLPESERMTWRRHTIRSGETLSTIAQKYNTNVSALKKLNNLRNSHRIRAGKALIVPIPPSNVSTASAEPAYKNKRRNISAEALENYARSKAPPKNSKKIVYVVKDNDTLGHIAERYNTSARKIRSWNGLSYRRFIYPGQKLAIYVSDDFSEDNAEVATNSLQMPTDACCVKQTHTVRSGDTFYSISRSYGVTLTELLFWNGRSARSVIKPGDQLDVWKSR